MINQFNESMVLTRVRKGNDGNDPGEEDDHGRNDAIDNDESIDHPSLPPLSSGANTVNVSCKYVSLVLML